VRFFTLIALLCAAAIAPSLRAQHEKLPPDDLDYVEKTWPGIKKTNTGIRYIIIHPGVGQPPQPGDFVSVLFVGTLLQGQMFEKAMNKNHPYRFRLGREEVIEGWDQVIQLMKPDSEWLVVVPPELAYGSRGRVPKVPAYATLVFTIHLVKVEREQ
jgi:FKBP-type peptidyl-prolyl cis-trans isomerase